MCQGGTLFDRHSVHFYSAIYTGQETIRTRMRTSGGLVIHESPIPLDTMEELPNSDLADLLRTFRGRGHWQEPSIQGLTGAILALASRVPGKLVDDMHPFKDVGYPYMTNMLYGLKDAWKEKREFHWGRLTEFLSEYCSQDRFWSGEFKVQDDEYNTGYSHVLGEIGSLVQDATQDDDWAMPAEHHEPCIALLKQVCEKYFENPDQDDNGIARDPITHTLNSTSGKLLTASLYLSLKIARTQPESNEEGKNETIWHPQLRALFRDAKSRNVPESFVLIGQYIAQLNYLDEAWLWTTIDGFQVADEALWSQFMSGYLFSSRVYADFYPKMITHYSRAIQFSAESKDFRERLVEHCALGYMANIDEFQLRSGTILHALIKQNQAADLVKLIHTFEGRPRFDPKKKDAARSSLFESILAFWRFLYDKFGQKPTEDERVVLSEVVKLTMFIDVLTEEYTEWILQAAPYVQKRFNASRLLELLTYQIKRGESEEIAGYIARIMETMTEHYLPDYRDEHVRQIVEFVYDNGDASAKELADSVVDKYARAGMHFLRQIWEKYNDQSQERAM